MTRQPWPASVLTGIGAAALIGLGAVGGGPSLWLLGALLIVTSLLLWLLVPRPFFRTREPTGTREPPGVEWHESRTPAREAREAPVRAERHPREYR